ncbi:NACHT domain-containing protein [Actinomadura roseirufa]|uniref:NACHT domain-containing protein n=1 Tax=Actinomadura roseirufa TaxID=2094049 RepID=UPI001041A755|nr:NACHT domain-containing protein [Actinomadura roseirufa]
MGERPGRRWPRLRRRPLVELTVRDTQVGGDLRQSVTIAPSAHGLLDRDRLENSRAEMLNNLETLAEGLLRQSVYRRVLLDLGLEDRPDLVDSSWDVLVEEGEREPVMLAPDETATAMVESRKGVLILGEPGAGKTTMLLGVLRDLVDRAKSERTRPIPVYFHLGTWSGQKRLDTWLVDELTGPFYGIHRDVALAWVQKERIAPLLDGLDELALNRRASCVESINAFSAAHGVLPVVVCCRVADYRALGRVLRLRTALLIQPLSRAKVQSHLERFGKRLAGVRGALRADPTLWELLRTPFLLGIAVRAYEGLPAEEISLERGSLYERRDRLIAAFVERTLRARRGRRKLDKGKVVRWLTYMARALASNLETALYVESITPAWVPERTRRSVARTVALISALLTAATAWLLAGLYFSPWATLALSAVSASITGLAILGAENQFRKPDGRSRPRRVTSALASIISTGLGVVALTAMMTASFGGFAHDIAEQFGAAAWTFSDFVHVVTPVVFAALVLGFPLVFAVTASLDRLTTRELRELPYGGGRRATWWLSVDLTLAVGVPLAAGLWTITGPRGLLTGALLGFCAGFLSSGRRLLTYWCVRAVLARNGLVPLRQRAFLDMAMSRTLLQKVGGSYAFAHRFLLEYFARLDLEDTPDRYRSGGLQSADVRPEFLLEKAGEVAHDAPSSALRYLRYAGSHLPAETFAPAAYAAAKAMKGGPAGYAVDVLKLVVDAGHTSLSPAAAVDVARHLISDNRDGEFYNPGDTWWDTAKTYLQLALDSGDPESAQRAADELSTMPPKPPPPPPPPPLDRRDTNYPPHSLF